MKTIKPVVGLAFIASIVTLVIPVPGFSYAATSSAGQIAIAGYDGNIHLYDMAAATSTALTDDAVIGSKQYSWPTWANDGQLAYFGISLIDDPPYRFGIFVQPLTGDPVTVYTSPDEVFTYAYWSPGECPAGSCRDLAVLYTSVSGGLAVRRVRSLDSGAEFTVEELAEGAPFYWDWSPDGQSMFWARFSDQLEIYDVASNTVAQTFAEQPGLQRAVDWSPVDNRLLAAVQTDGTSDLMVFDGDTRQVLAGKIAGIVSFEWSPDGSQVAYTDNDAGNLNIVDAQTGESVAFVSDDVVGFFWSPDGARIAYITLRYEKNDVNLKPAARPAAQDDEIPVIRWHVYEVASGVNTPLAAFIPTRDMLYYLQFYDQFSRSHRLWSPDSRYIVYSEMTKDGKQWVSLLDTLTPGDPPQPIMEGSFGVFSWYAAPPAASRG